MSEYRPAPMDNFDDFDVMVESCYVDQNNIRAIIPSTLEGCVVRVCDIIAYLGKDRQDAIRAKLIPTPMGDDGIGAFNPEIINNLEVNIIENSYGKPYIKLDEEHYLGLKAAKKANYALVQQVAEDFRQENGSIVCRELLGLTCKKDDPTPSARTQEYYKKRPCGELVYLAAEIVGKRLMEL